MKIVITGSLGHIGRTLTNILVTHGHEVIVVSSKDARRSEIENSGAKAAIGSVTDSAFLAELFRNADAVYTMVPPPADFHDPNFDMLSYADTVRNSYFKALSGSGAKHLVNLSSWGAHRSEGIGGIAASYHTEQLLNSLKSEMTITHIRPTSFYYNFFAFIPMIKHKGDIELNYGGEDIVSVVAPADIAVAVAEELETARTGIQVRYVTSDELSCNEIASILGNAIGQPDLQWIRILDEASKANLLAAGLSPAMATNVADIQGAIHKGYLAEDYKNHKPAFGKVKTADFAKEFAIVFNRK
ncbi:MAG: NAD-dependent epimerase/dehydratase family protein [Chitinophagaceae bacterium]|nr:MAG: NAD-dependent epimerase/dehydratase family protein [Chitinophagaceae bacterium]